MKFIAIVNDKQNLHSQLKIVTAIIINLFATSFTLNVCLLPHFNRMLRIRFFYLFRQYPADLYATCSNYHGYSLHPCSTVRKTLANNFLIFSAKHL